MFKATRFLAVSAAATVACNGTSDDGSDASASPTGGGEAIGTGGQQSSAGTGGAHSSAGGNGGSVVASGGASGGGGGSGGAATSTGGRNPGDSGAPWYCDESSAYCLCDHTQIQNPIGCRMKWTCCYESKSNPPSSAYCDCQEVDAAQCAGFEGPGNTGDRIVSACK